MWFSFVTETATVAVDTTQKQEHLTETNSTHLHKDALALIFLMDALREEIYKTLGGGGSEKKTHTHITSICLICSHQHKNNKLS